MRKPTFDGRLVGAILFTLSEPTNHKECFETFAFAFPFSHSGFVILIAILLTFLSKLSLSGTFSLILLGKLMFRSVSMLFAKRFVPEDCDGHGAA